MDGRQTEALRQQMLLRALWRDARPGVVEGWLRDPPGRKRRGLQAYQANAGALAERALGAAFPTIAALLGDESFASLARAFWHAHPPRHGDVAQWGGDLPGFLAAAESLADEPYLADVARLEWAVHGAEGAADDDAPVQGLERLATEDPSALRLRLRAGSALVVSRHPVASIWLAHRRDDAGRFAPVQAAFAAGRGEAALVWRDGLRARVDPLEPADARFVAATLAGRPLAQALDEAGADFHFPAWLATLLQRRTLVAVEPWATSPRS